MTTDIEQDKNRTLIEQTRATRFQPHESGNPKGRPPNSVTTLLKERGREDNKVIADKLYDLATEGDLKAIDMFIDRTDGKVPGDVQNSQDNSKNIYFILTGEQSKGLIEGISHRLGGEDDTKDE